MKTLIAWFALILTTSAALAQSVDYNKIILPDGAVVLDLEEKLVQLAWKNNPKTRIAAEAVTEAREQTRAIRHNWSNTIGVTAT